MTIKSTIKSCKILENTYTQTFMDTSALIFSKGAIWRTSKLCEYLTWLSTQILKQSLISNLVFPISSSTIFPSFFIGSCLFSHFSLPLNVLADMLLLIFPYLSVSLPSLTHMPSSRMWTLVTLKWTLSTESLSERMVGQGRVDPACPETSALLHMVRKCK